MFNTHNSPALFPGGVGLTHLRVYESASPDGLHGGSPHLHFACTECYYAVGGRGRVQTLSSDGFREFPLEAGGVVWFSPGVIHRLVNEEELEILVVMGNGGLPEAGDFVLTMPPALLADSKGYFDAASLSPHGEVFTSSEAAAHRRRDLAVEGFAELRADFEARGEAALQEFYEVAARLVAPKIAQWQTVWEKGPLVAAQSTGEQLRALQQGDVSHLLQGSAHAMSAPGEDRKWGMCGTLGTYLPEGVTVAQRSSGINKEAK